MKKKKASLESDFEVKIGMQITRRRIKISTFGNVRDTRSVLHREWLLDEIMQECRSLEKLANLRERAK